MSRRAALAAALIALAAAAWAESADDLARAGKAAFADAQYALAIRSFQKLLDDYPSSARAPEAAYLAGAALYLLDRPAEAVDRLEALRRSQPSSPLALQAAWWIGASWLKLGKPDKALPPLQELADASGADASWRHRARLLAGAALEELGRSTEAAAAYRALLAEKPADAVLAETLYRLAGIEYRAARYAPARDLYAKVLADHPGSAFVRDAVFFLAECEYALGADASAEKRYRTLLSVYADSPYRETATFRIAGILARTGRADAAMDQIEAYLASWPRGAYRSAAYRQQGDILYGRKRFEDALARYEKALAVAPDEASRQATRLAMGLAQAALGRRDQAVSLLVQAAGGPDPVSAARALFEQGTLLAGLGRDRETITALSAYVARFPTGSDREAVLHLLASVLERSGDGAGAWSRWDELVRSFPRSAHADEHLFRRAGAALRTDRLADAIEDYTRLGKDYPSSAFKAEASYGIGYAYTRRGEYTRALPFFQAALAAARDDDLAARAQLGLGIARFNLGSYAQALADFEFLRRKAKTTEREAEATMHAARTLYRLDRLDEAAARFREAAELGGDGAAEARYWLGWSLFRLNRIGEARDTFADAARRWPGDPRHAEMLLRAGVCETLLGRDGEAVALFDQALASAGVPKEIHEQALYEKGWALSRSGSAAEALAVFDRLAREHPAGTLAPDAFTKLASRALEQGRPAEARDLFLRVARDFPASPLAESAQAHAAGAALAGGDGPGALDLAWGYVSARSQGVMLDTVIDTFARALAAAGGAGPARTWDARVREAKALPAGTAARLRLACAGLILPDNPREAMTIVTEVRARPLSDRAAAEAGLLTGRYYVAIGDTARALETLDALVASRADRIGAEARMAKARLLESTGRTGDAVEEFLNLAYLYPDIEDLAAEALAQAARVARARGERDRARQFEDRLRKEYPDSPQATSLQPAR